MSDRWNELDKRRNEVLTDVEQIQVDYRITAILFGSENLLHLSKQGHIGSRMWENVEQNYYPMLQLDVMQKALRSRPGPLSRDLVQELERATNRPPSRVPKVFKTMAGQGLNGTICTLRVICRRTTSK